jgi:hypothetical protein
MTILGFPLRGGEGLSRYDVSIPNAGAGMDLLKRLPHLLGVSVDRTEHNTGIGIDRHSTALVAEHFVW